MPEKTCTKCGSNDFFPSGGCRPCSKAITLKNKDRIAARKALARKLAAEGALPPCKVCGGTVFIKDGRCTACTRRKNAEWRANNPEQLKVQARIYKEKHPDAARLSGKKFRETHVEREKLRHLTYRLENPEKIRDRDRKYRLNNPEKNAARHIKYRLENPEKVREKNRRYRLNNMDRTAARSKAWVIANPERAKETRRIWDTVNADKTRLRQQKWRKDNPELALERQRSWRRKNPGIGNKYSHSRRAAFRNAEGSFTLKDISDMLKAQGGKCSYCKTDISEKYHIDHIRALSKGGSNWPSNLQLLCPPCNLGKHAMDEAEFLRRKGYDLI